MYFSSFGPETLQRMVREVGFEMIEAGIESQAEQDTEIPYLWLLARKQ